MLDNQKRKYRHILNTNLVWGFVVSIHNSINYDIDLQFEDFDVAEKYRDVISGSYQYLKSHREKIDFENCVPITGTAYRCHIRGIDTVKKQPKNSVNYEIIRLINLSDGWVLCTLGDIDIYGRLLVDIVIINDLDHTTYGIKELLLKDKAHFCHYS